MRRGHDGAAPDEAWKSHRRTIEGWQAADQGPSRLEKDFWRAWMRGVDNDLIDEHLAFGTEDDRLEVGSTDIDRQRVGTSHGRRRLCRLSFGLSLLLGWH